MNSILPSVDAWILVPESPRLARFGLAYASSRIAQLALACRSGGDPRVRPASGAQAYRGGFPAVLDSAGCTDFAADSAIEEDAGSEFDRTRLKTPGATP